MVLRLGETEGVQIGAKQRCGVATIYKVDV